MIISGWLDMALTGASFETNRDKDTFFTRAGVEWLVASFLGDGDRRDPYSSPLYADLAGFPPIFLQAEGTRRWLMRAACSSIAPRTLGSMSVSMSSLRCCTPSR